MPICECGCGKATQGGMFRPGHDQVLRARLEARMGGLLAMRDLVETLESYVAGRVEREQVDHLIRQTFERPAEAP